MSEPVLVKLDALDEFLQQRCTLKDRTAFTYTSVLLKKYEGWSAITKAPPITPKQLAARLKESGCLPVKRDGNMGWRGIRFRGRPPNEGTPKEFVQLNLRLFARDKERLDALSRRYELPLVGVIKRLAFEETARLRIPDSLPANQREPSALGPIFAFLNTKPWAKVFELHSTAGSVCGLEPHVGGEPPWPDDLKPAEQVASDMGSRWTAIDTTRMRIVLERAGIIASADDVEAVVRMLALRRVVKA